MRPNNTRLIIFDVDSDDEEASASFVLARSNST